MTADPAPAPDGQPEPKHRRLLNLDVLEAEATAEPLEVQLRGIRFTLPATMPIGLPIFLNRAFTAITPAEEDRQIMLAVEAVFGERAEEALRAGFTLSQLVRVSESYGVQANLPESPASAPSLKVAGKRSRRPSKRTTASTSGPAASAPQPSGSDGSTPSS